MVEVMDRDEVVADPGNIGRVAIGDMLRRAARRFGDKTAVIEGETRTSFAELDAASNRFAHFLLTRGLGKGAKVVTLCNNSTTLLEVIFGIQKAGLVWVPINTMLAIDDIRYIAGHAEASLAIVDDNLYGNPALHQMLSELGIETVILEIANTKLDMRYPTVAGVSVDQPSIEPDIDIHERDLAQIMYTSGTTSRPKGVMHCHLSVYFAVLGNVAEWTLGRTDVATCMLPLFHCAQHVSALSFLAAGGSVVLMRGFDPAALLDAIERERMTHVIGLPLMYAAMLDHPKRREVDLKSLRLCVYAMAPMAKPLLTRLIEAFCPNFALCTGQTEMYPMTAMFRPEEQLKRFGNYWGESAIVNDTAIMDDDGNLLPREQVGEIVHRGPNVMLGYYKNPQATAEARRFGWHHTGDLGKFDVDGQLMFVDRKKDMIKSGGENIPSIKVEEVLLRHPAVGNAAVVGLPHPRWGEAVVAFVILKSGAAADEAALLDHCRQHLGGFEVPKSLRIVPALPVTATGKLRKNELKVAHARQFEGE